MKTTNDGAMQGELCGLCKEPMNTGAVVCSACGAHRETHADRLIVWLFLGAVVLSLLPLPNLLDQDYAVSQFGDYFVAGLAFVPAILTWIVVRVVVKRGRGTVTYKKSV